MRVKAKLKGNEEIELLEREKDNQSTKDGKYRYFFSHGSYYDHHRHFSSSMKTLHNLTYLNIRFFIDLKINVQMKLI